MADSKEKKEELLKMDRLLLRIAAFRGVLIADRTEAVMLFATFILFTVNKYYNPLPLYLCLFDLVVPLVLHGLLKNRLPADSAEDQLPLPLLRKKYKYSESFSKAHSFNFILMTLLLFIWNQNVTKTPPEYGPAKALPLALLVMYVLIRLIFWAYYLLLFKFNTMKAWGRI